MPVIRRIVDRFLALSQSNSERRAHIYNIRTIPLAVSPVDRSMTAKVLPFFSSGSHLPTPHLHSWFVVSVWNTPVSRHILDFFLHFMLLSRGWRGRGSLGDYWTCTPPHIVYIPHPCFNFSVSSLDSFAVILGPGTGLAASTGVGSFIIHHCFSQVYYGISLRFFSARVSVCLSQGVSVFRVSRACFLWESRRLEKGKHGEFVGREGAHWAIGGSKGG